MAEIRPFHALRYDPLRVAIQDVVTQPYDKITPEMQASYYAASPYNLVRIILGKAEPGDNGQQNVYTRAAQALHEWQRSGILKPDPKPSIYAYSQRFTISKGGSSHTLERRSFIALGRIYDYDQRIVFRHEQTLAKPKADRLDLLRATQAHFGQIFMLYSDPAASINGLLFSEGSYPDIEVSDEYGVAHRLRKVSDPHLLNIVTTEMADKKLVIADGHHRYETALNYRNEAKAGDNPRLAAAAEFVMMTFVNMEEPGLVVLPTHRVLFGLAGLKAADLLQRIEAIAEVSRLEGADPAKALERSSAQASEDSFFVLALKEGNYLLRIKAEQAASLLSDLSARQRRLDVLRLHRLVLNHALGIGEESIRQQIHIRYLRDAAEAVDSVHKDPKVNAAFLMNPVSIEQMRDVAFSGEVMPQKSTDFFPKLLSGLTIYSLNHESHLS